MTGIAGHRDAAPADARPFTTPDRVASARWVGVRRTHDAFSSRPRRNLRSVAQTAQVPLAFARMIVSFGDDCWSEARVRSAHSGCPHPARL